MNPKSKRTSLSRAVYIDGYYFPSLFAMAIDFEIDYSWLHLRLKNAGDAPIKIKGHKIVLESYLKAHPEYDIEKDKKENQK